VSSEQKLTLQQTSLRARAERYVSSALKRPHFCWISALMPALEPCTFKASGFELSVMSRPQKKRVKESNLNDHHTNYRRTAAPALCSNYV